MFAESEEITLKGERKKKNPSDYLKKSKPSPHAVGKRKTKSPPPSGGGGNSRLLRRGEQSISPTL